MLRARRMAESIMRFNCDNIPLYISVPAKNLPDFENCFSTIPCTFITDEDILEVSQNKYGRISELFPKHLLQQLVKLEFWRLNLCENYAWIDSDSYFIRNFKSSDFMFSNDTPYTIQDEYNTEQELLRMAQAMVPKKTREKRVRQNVALVKMFRGLFNNKGSFYLFSGTMPYIWSVKVLRSLSEDYLESRQQTIFELLCKYPCETQLYGEYLHFSHVIPIHPRPCMFKCFLYLDDFYISQTNGEYEYSLAKDYFGICMQSNWAKIQGKKGSVKRLKKHMGELGRTLLGLLSSND